MNIDRFEKLGDPIPKHIVILRALHLGDLLCAVPAFRALRAALPDAKISLVGLPWAKNFVLRFRHYLDDFIEFPGFPGMPERSPQIEHIPSFLARMQTMGFDLALQMQESGWLANSLLMMFGALFNAGFYKPGQYCPDQRRFMEYPEDIPEVNRHLKLMQFLGISSQGDYLEFPLLETDWQEFRYLERRFGLQDGHYVCIHPGSRASHRRWPAERFAAVADGLAERGFQIVLTGVKEEKSLISAVANRMKFSSIDLSGATTLGSLGALISKSRLVVCNDTGVSHVAAALRKASLVLFSSSNSTRWAPDDRSLHRIFESAYSVGPQAVLQEADKILRTMPSPVYAV